MDNWIQVESSKILSTKGFLALNRFLKKFFLILSIFIFAAVLLVNLNFVFISQLLFDVDLNNYRLGIFIYSLAVIFNSITQPFKYFINAIENTKTTFIAELIAVFVVALSGYTLIKNYELIGALVGIAIMKFSVLFVYLIVYLKKRKENIDRK